MKPARFDYHRATSVADALALKERYGADGSFLAGGQSLMPMLNMRLAQPEALIDLNRVAELDGIEASSDGLRLGAMTRQAIAQRDQRVQAGCPLIADALDYVAHSVIRNRGTVGGSVAHADVAAELPTALVALGGRIVARGPAGAREIPAEEFFEFHFTTSLAETELVTALVVPALQRSTGYAFLEVSRRHGDFAVASVAMTLTGGLARMAFGGVSSRPVVVESEDPDPAADAVAAAETAGIADDLTASRAYRRQLVAILARRARALSERRAQPGTVG
jgi:carbon-monoxide dehydrogenase medium subunit